MTNPSSDLRNYLNQFYLLTDSEYELFSSYFFLSHLAPKERLINEGVVEENIYFVVKGILRKYFYRDQQQVISGFFKEQDICNSAISYFTGLPSQLIIEAIEPSICIGINRRDLDFVCSQIPGLEKMFCRMLSSLYVKKDIEHLDNLRYSKKERFLLFCDNQPELLQRVPQKQLASFLEITPETFCRMKRVRYEIAKGARNNGVTEDVRA